MVDARPLSELFEEALRIQAGPAREAWMARACEGAEDSADELRRLLEANDAVPPDFLAVPFSPPALDLEAPAPDSVGPFRVEGEVGRGGMGVVYRATDTRLDRAVAIKALPSYFANNPWRMARFEQEARTLARLNHANIATLHGLEVHEGSAYLVLEFVHGETLEQRLKKGRLAVDEATRICAQIAAGTAAAHDAGVVHRDLKPANIKVTADGVVKVLDFGLAKMAAAEASESPDLDASGASAVSPVQTADGAVIGTPTYMSPEQARGRALDRRTDVWSFGIILYECLTGVSYFREPTSDDTLDAILKKPISFARLPPDTTPVVRHVLQRCLERDPGKRFRDLQDVRVALEGDSSAQDLADLARARPRWLGRGAAALVVLGLVIAFVAGLRTAPSPETSPRPVTHLFAPATLHRPDPFLAVAPDGRQVAYVGTDGFPVRWT